LASLRPDTAERRLSSLIRASSFLRALLNRVGALPRGASRRAVVPNFGRTLRPPKEGGGAPKFAGAETPHPWPALRSDRSRQRTGLPVHNADRRAFRRSTAALSLSLGSDFRTRKKPFELPDPAGFRLRSSAPPARTDGPIVLGRS